MPPKSAAKSYDLWGEEGDKVKSIKHEKVQISDQWHLDQESVVVDRAGPRRRPIGSRHNTKPNKRSAVAVPIEGQSYMPEDESHQAALAVAADQLAKKRIKHEKFIHSITYKGDSANYKGNLSGDKTWEEDVKESKPKAAMSAAALANEARKKKKLKNKKKKNKIIAKQDLRQAMKHKMHPVRSTALKQVAELDDIKATMAKKAEKRDQRYIEKRIRRSEGLQVKKFGRHVHMPLGVDVIRSDELVGNLRTMKGGNNHAALDRLKSLEERNLVPARMRHNYNKRRILKPKGDLMVRKEPVGGMLNTSKRQ